jgi:hypothetical protein
MPTELIQPGEPVKLFDANAVAAPVNSATYALPTSLAKVISWSCAYASAPSATNIKLQVSNDGTVWTDLDSSTVTAGEVKTTNPTNAIFLRARKESQTGGGALTLLVVIGF